MNATIARMKFQGLSVISLAGGEPDFETPPNIKEAAKVALDNNFTYCTSATGLPELRERICEWHANYFKTRFDPSNCIVTPGAKYGLFLSLAALIEPGDEVILPAPYWTTFREAANYFGAVVRTVPTTSEARFRLTSQAVVNAFTDRTRLVILNSPCNPTGMVISREDMEAILTAARRKDIFVVTDESYGLLLYEGLPFSLASLPSAENNVIVIGSFSKTFAMTGWRIGYVLGPAPLIKAVAKLQSHSTSHANSISQAAAIEALTGPQNVISDMVASYKERRDLTIEILNGIPGVTCHNPPGAFYAYPDISCALKLRGIGTVEQFTDLLLREAQVAALPGDIFGSSNHIRISFATQKSQLEAGLQRLRQFLIT